MEREILLLGNPKLYEVSEEVRYEELEDIRPVFEDMFDCIRGIRHDYGFGRAIAAPQIGVLKLQPGEGTLTITGNGRIAIADIRSLHMQ